MNPLLRKEIRSIRPTFIIACLLILLSGFNSDYLRSDAGLFWHYLSEFFYPAAILILSLGAFGEEVNHGTLASLLMLPVPRREIWRIKVGTLAVSLLILAVLKCALPLLPSHINTILDVVEPYDRFGFILLFNLVIFSGSLWSVLLLRQVANAFWFTLLTPIILLLLVNYFLPNLSPNATIGVNAAIICAYGIAGFFFARRLFFHAQDLSFVGGNINLTWREKNLFTFSMQTALRRWRPRAALWRKEVMLQQSQFIVAFVLAFLHLGILVVRKTCDLRNSPDLKFALENFWLLWLLLPLLVGAAAIAEERKLGTLASQLCLSARVRTQFLVKLAIVLILSIFFGALLPYILEGTNIYRVLDPAWVPSVSPYSISIPGGLHKTFYALKIFGQYFYFPFNPQNLMLLSPLAVVSAFIGLVSFYVSSFTRNVLQALAPALFLLISSVPLLNTQLRNILNVEIGSHLLWRGPLILLIGLPVTAMTFCILTAYNFRQIRITAKTYRTHLGGWFTGLLVACTVTALTYNRVWERVWSPELSHGQPRLSLSHPLRLKYDYYGLSINLDDGRIWLFPYNLIGPQALPTPPFWRRFRLGTNVLMNPPGSFYAGSDWREIVTTDSSQRLGLKTDGTLWIAGQPAGGEWSDTFLPMPSVADWTQVGTNADWRSAANHGINVWLIKTNNTLWSLGSHTFPGLKKPWPDLRNFAPEQIGSDSDWDNFAMRVWALVTKTDGSLWFPTYNPITVRSADTASRQQSNRMLLSHSGGWLDITDITDPADAIIGIDSDGTLRAGFTFPVPSGIKIDDRSAGIPLGNQTNWLRVAANPDAIVTLRKDGTLWLWEIKNPKFLSPATTYTITELISEPRRLSRNSDWVGLIDCYQGFITLAADGGLWYWSNETRWPASPNHPEYGNPLLYPLLKPSLHPRLLGNIFDSVKK